MGAGGAGGDDEVGDAQFVGQFVEGLPLYDFAPCIGEKSFSFSFKALEYDVAHDGTKHGVAEKLEPLVVDGFPFLLVHDALVHQCLLVIFDVVGVEAKDVV